MMMMKPRNLVSALTSMAALSAAMASADPFIDTNPIDSGNLTWNVVQLSRVMQARPAGSSRHWFSPLDRTPTVHMGLYLGQADTLPRSVVGWDSRQDIASRVRYGIYLINPF